MQNYGRNGLDRKKELLESRGVKIGSWTGVTALRALIVIIIIAAAITIIISTCARNIVLIISCKALLSTILPVLI